MLDVKRTVISALHPRRCQNDCSVVLTVWFEELAEPTTFVADPFDVEPHGRQLWIRAMAGEYGTVEIIDKNQTGEQWLTLLK